MRLDREDGMFWRSYYGFLAGLPMKIADPGARLDPEVAEANRLRLPRYREWYTNEGDRFLGSGEIRSVTVR